MQNENENLRLVDTAYDAICASLSNGKIKPGDWLRQLSLAEELKVSQATVRDALNKLVGAGLAERIPRKGVQVPYISPEDLRDIYELRLVIESQAWEAAAEKISPAELDFMRSILPYTGTTADPLSVNTARERNQEFHMTAIKASGRWVLIRLLSQLLNLNNLRYLLNAGSPEIRVEDGKINIQEHEALIAALEQKNSSLVHELITNHIKRSMSDRLTLYWKTIDPGSSIHS